MIAKGKPFQKGCTPHNKGLKGWTNSGSFKKGHTPICPFKKGNKLRLGKKHTKIVKEKMEYDKHWNWKGDKAGLDAMHGWIYRHKGKPKVCKFCGATYKERKLVWANKDHTYKRVLDDYISLCYPCHKKYDLKQKIKNNI